MTTLTNASKKIFVGAAALAFLALGATDCFAAGCPEPCVAHVKKVTVIQPSHGENCPVPCVVEVREVTEPACAAELPQQLGTAVRVERNGDTVILNIMGKKAEVDYDYFCAKSDAISDGSLVFVEEYHNLDTDEASVKLIMKENLPYYNGFAKVKHFEGDFDTISELSAKYSQKGYEILDFDGFGYEPHPKAYLVTGKLF